MVPLFVSYAIFLVLLSGLKSAGLFLTEIYALEHWMGGDKWMHFGLALILSLLANMAAERKLPLKMIGRIVTVVMLLVTALLIDEAHQYYLATRRFEWQDTASGTAGVLAGVVLYVIGMKSVLLFSRKKANRMN